MRGTTWALPSDTQESQHFPLVKGRLRVGEEQRSEHEAGTFEPGSVLEVTENQKWFQRRFITKILQTGNGWFYTDSFPKVTCLVMYSYHSGDAESMC